MMQSCIKEMLSKKIRRTDNPTFLKFYFNLFPESRITKYRTFHINLTNSSMICSRKQNFKEIISSQICSLCTWVGVDWRLGWGKGEAAVFFTSMLQNTNARALK